MSTILVVDDKKDMREIIERHLQSSGHRVLTASGAQAGLDLDRAFGGVTGAPWTPAAERWIYRAVKPGAPAGRKPRRPGP